MPRRIPLRRLRDSRPPAEGEITPPPGASRADAGVVGWAPDEAPPVPDPDQTGHTEREAGRRALAARQGADQLVELADALMIESLRHPLGPPPPPNATERGLAVERGETSREVEQTVREAARDAIEAAFAAYDAALRAGESADAASQQAARTALQAFGVGSVLAEWQALAANNQALEAYRSTGDLAGEAATRAVALMANAAIALHDVFREGQFQDFRAAELAAADPAALALTVGDEIVLTSRTYIRRDLIGYQPFIIWVGNSLVVAIESRAERIVTVRLIETNATVLGVLSDPVLPTVGKRYIARKAVALQPGPAERGPALLFSWTIKVPAGTRWLYRKVPGETVMYRWPWPPPEDPQTPWEVEVVQEHLVLTWHLFGGTTSPDEQTEIALKDPLHGAAWHTEGMAQASGIGERYHHLSKMGFDVVSREYNIQPDTLDRLREIANDGTTTCSRSIVEAFYDLAGGIEFRAVLVQDGHWVCCLPNPADGVIYCNEVFSFHYEFQAEVLRAVPTYTPAGAREWGGHLGTVNSLDLQARPTVIEHHTSITHNVWSAQHCTSTGACEWSVTALFPVFTDMVCDLTHDTQPNGVTGDRLLYEGEEHYGAAIMGAWEYGGISRIAWVDEIETWITHPWPGEGLPWTPNEAVSGRFDVRTVGGIIGDGLSLPSYDDFRHGRGALAPRLMALDPDTLELIIWWRKNTDSGTIVQRTRGSGALVTIEGVSDVVQLSRDGQDVIAWRGSGSEAVQVYSTDSGDHWALLPSTGMGLCREHADGMEFVDEVS